MTNSVPEYMTQFRCLAGECLHTCCAGWEIDIDEETRAKYARVSGAFGKRLREGIAGDHFRLVGKEERCPMLKQEGLCDIILTLGEDALCQICRDHPRYVHEYEDGIEIGLGLTCEAAAKLILNWKEPVRWTGGRFWAEDGDEAWLLDLREEWRERLQDRSVPMEERLWPVWCELGEYVDCLKRLECMSPIWMEWLDAVAKCERPTVQDALWLEQLAVYLLDRHLPDALYDEDVEARLRFVSLSIRLMDAMRRATGVALEELCRVFSSEIEYSDENMGVILDWIGENAV